MAQESSQRHRVTYNGSATEKSTTTQHYERLDKIGRGEIKEEPERAQLKNLALQAGRVTLP
jgi:hypothetical protein